MILSNINNLAIIVQRRYHAYLRGFDVEVDHLSRDHSIFEILAQYGMVQPNPLVHKLMTTQLVYPSNDKVRTIY